MKDRITEILNGDVYPSVYLLDVALNVKEIARLQQDKGTKVFTIDGDRIVDSISLFQEFAAVMQFPEYFGHNWDALQDCLTELDGHEVDRYIITINKLDRFIANDFSQWTNFLDVCKSVVEYWQDTETPLYILLHGNLAES
jgi:RNAse (barnase) inhibitor barstar